MYQRSNFRWISRTNRINDVAYVDFEGICALRLVGKDLWLKETPQEKGQRGQIERSRCPLQFASARDDHVRKRLVQNVHRSMCSVARSAALLKPHVVQIHILDFRPKEVGYHRPVSHTIDGDSQTTPTHRPKIRTKQSLSGDALPLGEPRVDWSCPNYGNFACLHSHSPKNAPSRWRWFFFLPKSASTSNCSNAQSAKTALITLSTWVSWTLSRKSAIFLADLALRWRSGTGSLSSTDSRQDDHRDGKTGEVRGMLVDLKINFLWFARAARHFNLPWWFRWT